MTRKASFPPIAAPDARLLILGSLPGDRSLAERRYYAHPQNQFWRLIGAAIDRELATFGYEERLAALRAHHIALWDVVATAHRHGSGDAAIRDADANDLPGLIAMLPALRAIAFNGQTAHRHGAALAAASGLPLIVLPSSSPLHTIGFTGKMASWVALRQYL